MNQNNISNGLASFSNALTKYLDLGTNMKIENAQAEKKNQAARSLKEYENELDIKKMTATETYKLTLEGKMDAETAASLHPEAAKLVENFNTQNKRYPTVNEFDKLFSGANKANENSLQRDNLDEQRQNRFLDSHAKYLNDKGFPKLVETYNQLAEVFKTGEDVKGVGTADQFTPGFALNFLSGPQAVANRENLQQLANVLLQQQSGAAVSDPEYKRFLKQASAGNIESESATRVYIAKMGLDLKKMIGTKESGLPRKALEEYKGRQDSTTSDQVKLFDGKAVNKGGNKGPTVGTIMDGYRFKGGDPADQNNWEK